MPWRPLISALALGIVQAKETLPVSTSIVSPDGLFEAYSKPEAVIKDARGEPWYFGEKLYVRLHGSKDIGQLVRENSRWLHYQWAPHSHLLGVEDDWDGHSSGVYVYAVSLETISRHLQYKLVFQSPGNEYDRQWAIQGWDMLHRAIRLHCDGRYQPEGTGGYEFEKTFPIGSRELLEK